jgi:hypothetical protein
MTLDIRVTEEEWLTGGNSWQMLHHLLNVGAFPARKQIQFCVEVCRLRGEALPAGYLAPLLELEAIADELGFPALQPAMRVDVWLSNDGRPLRPRFASLRRSTDATLQARYRTLLLPHEDAHWEGDPRFKIDDAVFYATMGHVFGCCYCDKEDRETHSPREAALLRELLGNPFRPAVIAPAWRTPTVMALATVTREERAFDTMPILADALEEAGCTDTDILEHLRSPGPHVRGCWALGLVLARE